MYSGTLRAALALSILSLLQISSAHSASLPARIVRSIEQLGQGARTGADCLRSARGAAALAPLSLRALIRLEGGTDYTFTVPDGVDELHIETPDPMFLTFVNPKGEVDPWRVDAMGVTFPVWKGRWKVKPSYSSGVGITLIESTGKKVPLREGGMQAKLAPADSAKPAARRPKGGPRVPPTGEVPRQPTGFITLEGGKQYSLTIPEDADAIQVWAKETSTAVLFYVDPAGDLISRELTRGGVGIAAKEGVWYITPPHDLDARIGLLKFSGNVQEVGVVGPYELGVLADTARPRVTQHAQAGPVTKSPTKPKKIAPRAPWRDTPLMNKVGTDLTSAAQDGKLSPVVGRDAEIDRVIRVLARRRKNNPVLVGEPGVGKTAIVEGLAQRIAAGTVPTWLQNYRIVSIDVSALSATDGLSGQLETQVLKFLDEAKKHEGELIVFLDEIHQLHGAGASEGSTITVDQMLKGPLARRELTIIGGTTPGEYQAIEKDPALERRLEPVRVNEPDTESTRYILEATSTELAAHHKVTFAPDAIASAMSLSERYLGGRFLPDKAIDLLDDAAAMVANAGDTLSREVTPGTIAKIVEEKTGIPVQSIKASERDKLLAMPKTLQASVIGQDEAVKEVVSAVRRSRTGLGAPNRPIGNFLFLGPTGVGKTEMARALAKALFDDPDAMVRINLGSFSGEVSASRLIGGSPNYVGHDQPGALTEPVRQRPYQVVLLDELEKAGEDVRTTLLELDAGSITDAKGRKVDFRNTVVIATSNLKREELVSRFSPEYLNRFDAVIDFNALAPDDVLKIVDLRLTELQARVSAQGSRTLRVTPAARAAIAKEGYDPQFGARSLNRVITRRIESPLADMIITGELKEKGTVEVDFKGGEFKYSVSAGGKRKGVSVSEAPVLTSALAELPNKPGEMIVTPAQIGSVSVPRMLVDTGAAVSTISPALARSLKIDLRKAEHEQFQAAGGAVVKAPMVTIPSLRVGRAETSNVRVAVADMGGGVDGVIGKDFLDKFDVHIKPNALTLDALRR